MKDLFSSDQSSTEKIGQRSNRGSPNGQGKQPEIGQGSGRSTIAKAINDGPANVDRPDSVAPVANRTPTVVSTVQPVRPRSILNFGVTGTVEVSFWITAHGTVEQAKIHRSNDSLLEVPVLAASKQWKFNPR